MVVDTPEKYSYCENELSLGLTSEKIKIAYFLNPQAPEELVFYLNVFKIILEQGYDNFQCYLLGSELNEHPDKNEKQPQLLKQSYFVELAREFQVKNYLTGHLKIFGILPLVKLLPIFKDFKVVLSGAYNRKYIGHIIRSQACGCVLVSTDNSYYSDQVKALSVPIELKQDNSSSSLLGQGKPSPVCHSKEELYAENFIKLLKTFDSRYNPENQKLIRVQGGLISVV